MSVRWFSGLVLLCGLVAPVASMGQSLLPTQTTEDLRFEFTIDPMIDGTRVWDYTGPGSSAIDDLDIGSALFGEGVLGSTADAVLGTALDESVDRLQETFAPPDPYLCVIAIGGGLPVSIGTIDYQNAQFTASCTQRSDIRPNRTQFNLDLPSNIARLEIFGVALVDSDAEQFLQDGGRYEDADDGDELIGFGLYVNEYVRTAIQERDPSTLELVTFYENRLPDAMRRMFRFNAGPSLELEKVTVSRCNSGCRFGNATVVIKDTVGGW